MLFADKNIVVTRPLAQAQNLFLRLENDGAKVIHFPCIEISASSEQAKIQSVFQSLEKYSLVIFISSNAAYYAQELIKQFKQNFSNCNIAAIGPATTKMLEDFGYEVAIVPSAKFSSEALLELEALQNVKDKNILIVRGMGGRETLRQILETRGANVEYAEVYQREKPSNRSPVNLSDLSVNETAVLLNSVDTAQNLWTLCTTNEQKWLADVKYVAGNQRIADAAIKIGFANNFIISENPNDESMLTALKKWVQTIER